MLIRLATTNTPHSAGNHIFSFLSVGGALYARGIRIEQLIDRCTFIQNGRSTWWNAYQAIRKTHTATSLWTNRRVMKKNMASSAEWVLRQNTSEAITIKWLRSSKRRNPIRLTTSTRMWTCVPLNARHPIFLYSYDALRTAACSASNPQYS